MLLHVLKLPGIPIFKQLQLEEALLRADERNWCLINAGTDPAIVMGISGKPEQLIDLNAYREGPVPLIRRFSGGGTVFVDNNTYFVTFICNSKDSLVASFPDRVLCWSKQIYSDVLHGHAFNLNENDYTLGNKKFGGNAQYMCKGRWLHHSSLLWDYDPVKMNLLAMPPKMPAYRAKRPHHEFLCPLKAFLPEKEHLEQKLLSSLEAKWTLKHVDFAEAEAVIERPHRRSTCLIDLLET